MKLTARSRRTIHNLLKRGMPIRLEIDGPVGVEATLSVKGAGGRRRVVARAKPSVALDDLVDLMLKPTKGAKAALGARKRTTARLRVVATDSKGSETVLTRRVTLTPQVRRAPRK